MPLITTIIPTYRRPKLLRRAIKSVLNQSYPYFKICVYDNASGDETKEIVSELTKNEARITYHCQPENIGALNNFNYGLSRVTTPFFSLISDDDVLLPNFFEIALEGFQNSPEAKFISTQVIAITENGKVVGRNPNYFPPGFYEPYNGFKQMIRFGPPTWTGILFRKELISGIGLLNVEVGVPSDYEYELRIASRYPYLVVGKPGAIFSVNNFSYTGSNSKPYPLLLPQGRLKMYKVIEEQYNIPLYIKKRSVSILKRRHKNMLLGCWYSSISENKITFANDAAKLIGKMYGEKTLSRFLMKIIPIIKMKIVRSFLKRNYQLIRRFVKNMDYKRNDQCDLQAIYGCYSKYLDIT